MGRSLTELALMKGREGSDGRLKGKPAPCLDRALVDPDMKLWTDFIPWPTMFMTLSRMPLRVLVRVVKNDAAGCSVSTGTDCGSKAGCASWWLSRACCSWPPSSAKCGPANNQQFKLLEGILITALEGPLSWHLVHFSDCPRCNSEIAKKSVRL